MPFGPPTRDSTFETWMRKKSWGSIGFRAFFLPRNSNVVSWLLSCSEPFALERAATEQEVCRARISRARGSALRVVYQAFAFMYDKSLEPRARGDNDEETKGGNRPRDGLCEIARNPSTGV